MCGEKPLKRSLNALPIGSPPRVRGKASKSSVTPSSKRITPACAGKRRGFPRGLCAFQDHPRVCGEKKEIALHNNAKEGSPPRVRGKGNDLADCDGFVRITPACAGEGSGRPGRRATCRDHPRVCGEKTKKGDLTCRLIGSPPRVRGKVAGNGRSVEDERITPACAGKSHLRLGGRQAGEGHPRVCGEKIQDTPKHVGVTGSPPRVRGKGARSFMTRQRNRITPACAGKRTLWRAS